MLSEAITLHKAGKVRILASSGARRSPIAADIPTFTELGYPQIQGDGFFAFHTRAGTPSDQVEKLAAAAAAAMRAPDVSDRLLGLGFGLMRGLALASLFVLLLGFTPLPQTPEWRDSHMLPGFQRGAEWLRGWLPAEVAEHVRFAPALAELMDHSPRDPETRDNGDRADAPIP